MIWTHREQPTYGTAVAPPVWLPMDPEPPPPVMNWTEEAAAIVAEIVSGRCPRCRKRSRPYGFHVCSIPAFLSRKQTDLLWEEAKPYLASTTYTPGVRLETHTTDPQGPFGRYR